MANKLHELLAVEQDRKNAATKALTEALNTFTKKDTQFDGMVKRYIPMEEDAELIPDEAKELSSSIKAFLEDSMKEVKQGIDAHIAKEETNCSGAAKAELVVNGQSLGTFSATSLLALEGHLLKIKELYRSIPVLDAARKWQFDAQLAVYQTEPEIKFRSIKRPKVIVKYEATDKHPAQTELLHLDIQVGKYETVYTSGKLSAAHKTELMRRIEALLEGVKIARSKANNAEVVNTKIADKLFNFIHKDIL